MVRPKYIEIQTVGTEVEKELLRTAFESCGVKVVFHSFLPPSVYPGLASIKVLVPEKDLELARQIITEMVQE